jgi:hypothetical protein
MAAAAERQVLVVCRPAYLLQQKQQLTLRSLTQLWFKRRTASEADGLGFEVTVIWLHGQVAATSHIGVMIGVT